MKILAKISDWLFLLLIFSLPFVQPFYLVVRNSFVPLTDLIFLAAFAVWTIAVLRGEIDFRGSKFYLPLAIYLSAITISVVFSVNRQTSAIKLLGEIYLLGLAVLTFNLARSIEDARRAISVWLAATTVICLFSVSTLILFYFQSKSIILNYTLADYGTLPPGGYPRIKSLFMNSNMLANYLTVSVVFAFIGVKFGWIKFLNSILLGLLLAVAVAFSLSPGIGGVLLAVCLWFWLQFKQKSKPRLALLSLAAGILIAASFYAVTFVSPTSTPTSPFYVKIPVLEKRLEPSSRFLAWKTALETFRENPIFGRGLGTDVANAVYLNPSGRLENLTDAHNIFINVAAQEGVFGLAAILFLIVFLLRRARPLEFDVEPRAVLRVGFAVAFVSAFAYQGLYGAYEDARHLWVLIGLLASFAETPPENIT